VISTTTIIAGAMLPQVFLIDDDPSILRALSRGLCAHGFRVRAWVSALAFLREEDPLAPGCVVADVTMQGLDGLGLQAALAARGEVRPIIFITGNASIPMAVQAMRAGALAFLQKPVQLADLTAAIYDALAQESSMRESCARRAAIEDRLLHLTAREREVLTLVVSGYMNKQIAAELGTAEKTVKVHRRRVMQKMHARSVAQLVMMSSELGIRGDWS
jgi:RNA polymerase sigma factor (sigma-70 family)